MATTISTTPFVNVFATGVTTFTQTIPATTAGNKLVVQGAGGAVITCRITNSSGTVFTKRTTTGSGAQDCSIQDFTCVGGETTVHFTLNGAENVSGTVTEVSGLGAFIGASNNVSGATTTSATDYMCKPTTSVNVASGNAIAFGVFSATSSTNNVDIKWRQLGPWGKQLGTGNNQPGNHTQHIWQTAVADVTAAGRWPLDLANAGDYRITSVFIGSAVPCFSAQAIYANAGSAIVPAAANPVVGENSLPGSYVSSWLLGSSATNANIAGYCDKPSYAPGDTVNFKVDSGNGAFRVEIYRLGHYGYDLFGARNQLGAQGGYIVGTPAVQSAPSVDSTLGSSSCAWSTTATWAIPATAVPGVYHVIFRSTVTTTNTSMGQFIVTGSAIGKTTVIIPDMTYQAYNPWGGTTDNGVLGTGTYSGRSLYQAGSDGATSNAAHRAYAVSMDRPMATQNSQSQTYFYDSEMEFINFAEAQGYNLTYCSTWDLDANTTLLNNAALIALPGHHEYWTSNVYDCLTHAVDAGVNLFFESSNTALWRTRFAGADTNRRTVICYKDSLTRDNTAGFTGTGYDPVTPTGTWRDATATNSITNPDRRVEDALTGQLFIFNGPTTASYGVPFASKSKPIWRNSAAVQALTTGNTYTTAKNNIGYEADYPSGGATQPSNQVSLNPTSVTNNGRGVNANGTVYTGSPGALALSMTLHRRSSGALVFNTGSWRGWWGVGRFNGGASPVSGGAVDLAWQNALLAVLFDLGATPVTLRAMRESDTAVTDPATGAPGGTRDNVATAYGLAITIPDKAGGAASAGAGVGAKAVARARTGSAVASSAGTGVKTVTSAAVVAKSGSAASAGAGTGVRTVTPATVITKSGSAVTAGAGSGAKTVAGAAVVVKTGSAAAVSAGIGSRSTTSARAGSAVAAGAGTGSKTVTAAGSIVKSGGAVAAGAGVGSAAVAHSAVAVKTGAASAVGVGFGVDVVARPGPLTKAGGSVAFSAGVGARTVTSAAVVAKTGGAVASSVGSGTRIVVAVVITMKVGGAVSFGAGVGTRTVTHPAVLARVGGAVATAAGSGTTNTSPPAVVYPLHAGRPVPVGAIYAGPPIPN